MKSNTIKTGLELLIIAALLVGSYFIGKNSGTTIKVVPQTEVRDSTRV